MCIILYGTQMGEILFCAYNTGVGFRQIIEKMKRTASVDEWVQEHGKHPTCAKNQSLPLLPGTPDVIVRGPRDRRRLRLVS